MAERRVTIVTGSGHGIGKAIAEMFVGKGDAVVIAEVDRETGAETQRQLKARGEALFVATDVSSEAGVQAMVDQAIKAFGRIDVLVNNAGIIFEEPFAEASLSNWNRVIAINLTGAFLCAKYCAPFLKKNGGSIINIASGRALQSHSAGGEAYAASKGGIIALTHALAMSLGPAVRVNCISPGWILTRKIELRREQHAQHPVGRVGRPEDIASAVLFLADPANSFITAETFIVDGGMAKKMMYV